MNHSILTTKVNNQLTTEIHNQLMNSSVQDLAVYAAKRRVELNPAYTKIKHELVLAAYQGNFELSIPLENPSLAVLPFSKEKIFVNQESFLMFKKEGFTLRVINRYPDGSNMSFSLHNAAEVVISWDLVK